MITENGEYNEEGNYLSLDKILEVLGNPTRRIILSKLAKVPLGASEIAASFGKTISRQAIHTHLQKLLKSGIIETIEREPKNIKYRIKNNISLRIDLSPDYYNVQYNIEQIEDDSGLLQLKDIGCQVDYDKLEKPDEKLRFLGEKIQDIEKNIAGLENKRGELIQNKECLIVELKNIMARQYEEQIRTDLPNLEKELLYTIFYNPMKHFKKINIDSLLNEMFSDLSMRQRDVQRVSIRYLLNDLSGLLKLFRKQEDDWFFDI